MSPFDKIIGHSDITRELGVCISKGKIPHAILFSGPAGIGKRAVAQAFAAAVFSANDPDRAAEHLRLIESGNHPDLHILSLEEDKKDISVESARELMDRLQLKPYFGHSRAAVVDTAHRLSTAACNALLKTLEEPPPGSFLILISESSHRLPRTILSRCQTVHFSNLSKAELSAIIQRLLDKIKDSGIDAKKLAAKLNGNLASLQLGGFIDPRSLELADEKGLVKSLRAFESLLDNFEPRFEKLLTDKMGIAAALSLASEIGASDDERTLWFLLAQSIHRSLQVSAASADTESLEALASACMDLASSEQLVFDRNANSALHLSSLFLSIAS